MSGKQSLDRGTQYLPYILASLAVALVPHVLRLPFWIVAWVFGFWGYAWGISKRGWLTPGDRPRQILTLCGFAGGVITFGFSFDLDVGVALLALMVGLKPLEIRNHRDRMMTLFLSYFLVITSLFYSSALGMILYLLASVFLTTAVLIRINHTGGRLAPSLVTAARILVLALPLTIVLFAFFPRLHGGLWGTPRATGTTGFSDRLSPGSMSELVKNPAIAFRVKFADKVPPRDQLYWRGIVFTKFDGQNWGPGRRTMRSLRPLPDARPITYAVTLEPHHQRWLFALDLPFKTGRGTRIYADRTLRSWRRVHSLLRYEVTSYTRYHTGPMYAEDWHNLQLPPGANPRARTLAQQWADAAENPAEIVDLALTFFRENAFFYSLQAPATGEEMVDDFLFKTRKGYCEYYAAAFAFLMRAAGVPARVVGGYLGGEMNPYADYLIVRQSDAHVWVEVWLPETGWTRVDPTAQVAPARVAQGLAAALAPEERNSVQLFAYLGPLAKYWKQIQFGWDMANNRWNQWVIVYSRSQQRVFFAKLGLQASGWKTPALGVAVAAGFVGLYFAWIAFFPGFLFRRRPAGPADEARQAYLTYCLRLAGAGLPRAPFLGPVDYARRVIEARPDLEVPVRRITALYVDIRYARAKDREPLQALKTHVRLFRPGKGGIPKSDAASEGQS